ncbi:GNAT family N-acetyltransferase [Pontibacter sp. JH31]|uniref:GNAT family N-acetyltransferase n=1 Tax=Pontibacter aquaedesilientis TaxID=2766980 RepID=A0ABR7XJS2_9BACT|nr:GNAT family N-acetyltransferase [Pontibacter aquaedesilientis]MBD1398520.1 GNAT family N-acetyltransferase [Pontibacter aquaedesilientis]
MIRPYATTDREALLHILRLNTPRYFAPEEEADFAAYLDEHLEAYFVVEQAGQIVGAGGLNYFDDNTWARISWDLIHPDFQGQGIGKALTQFRIEEARKQPNLRLIQVRTSQLVYPFYQKLGFVLEKVEKDFWAVGFDLYQMNLAL